MKNSREIRQTFLNFFKEKLHHIERSAPIVVKNDPTLMFTNAGMNQFKDIFLGQRSIEHPRVADTQKCLRVSGKHNDLEEVGHDTYHHTMFEMLGNWSFGDYYKAEAIAWAWELLTKHFQLDPDRLYATVFEGDETDGTSFDQEAADEWGRWLPSGCILKGNKKDNFWEMGETGPAGPCSEIHIDLRPESERTELDGKELVNQGHPQVIEIWNLVFIQYNRKSDGSLEELPQKHVDTGMGFERLVMALQEKRSTYDTDLFDATREFLEERTGITYAQASESAQVAFRVVMDHIRAIVFTIADGQIPSNTGAGYVIRRILRRASRYAFSELKLGEPFLYELVPLLAGQYQGVFPEVEAQKDFIARIIREEEKGFLRKLEQGTQMFEEYLHDHRGTTEIDGDFAFKLYDTYGFPIDLTQLMARERGKSVDMGGFSQNLEEQKSRSRQAGEMKAGDWVVLRENQELPRFLGYDTLEVRTIIQQYRTVKSKNKVYHQVVLEETPFYAESGGQIGDRGVITNGTETLQVLDTQKENDLIIHFTDKLPENPGGEWTAEVYANFRKQVKANHTATHLLHAALREILGTHVEQRGSLVSDELLRFDFSHFAKVSDEDLEKIEEMVNDAIARDIPFTEYRQMPIEEAQKMGAMALFGEKYGDKVRVVVFDHDFSVEFCGGTHVDNTGEIRLFKLISEGSVAAGIRRVEAYTGGRALAWLNAKVDQLDRLTGMLKGAQDPEKAVADLIEENRRLEKNLEQLSGERLVRLRDELIAGAESRDGFKLIRQKVDLADADELKRLAFEIKKNSKNTLTVLGTKTGEKALLAVILSDDLAETGRFHAGKMIRQLAREIKGGGGGQPFFATAGGKDPSGIEAALSKVDEFI